MAKVPEKLPNAALAGLFVATALAIAPEAMFAYAAATWLAVKSELAVKVSPFTVTDSPVRSEPKFSVAVELAVAPELNTLEGALKLPELRFKENGWLAFTAESSAANPPLTSLPEMLL